MSLTPAPRVLEDTIVLPRTGLNLRLTSRTWLHFVSLKLPSAASVTGKTLCAMAGWKGVEDVKTIIGGFLEANIF